jgi:hypothetical protein
MSNVKITCDRCHKEVDGMETDYCTGGFYKVENSYWSKFAYTGETKVCDRCMWEHPMFIQIYGRHK